MSFIEIRSVAKAYGSVRVLDDVDLTIEHGEFVVFVGPSGCGKSTLLRMVSGLETISAGTIAIDGEVVNDLEPAARGVSMVFQSYALYPHMTTAGNVSFGLRMAHTPRPVIAESVRKVAEILRLGSLIDRRPSQLSGGQKQRVAIGRAIVREPRLFLFDEPLSNLDAELRVQMRAELTDLHRRLGTTMIYVTHDQVEAMTLADTMVVMNGGRIQQAGAPLTLYDDPDNLFVAGFVGSPKMNFLPAATTSLTPDGVHLGHVAGVGEAFLPLAGLEAPSTTVTIGMRPEHLRILAAGETGSGLVLEGRVLLVEELGSESFVHMELTDGTRIIVRSGRRAAAAQAHLRVEADLAAALLFDEKDQRLRGAGRGR
ncbi:ABC transporter ATP-binding protein [Rhizobium sp. YIM 134829]|uniref:ABC transporter ATP-binding protein n=1 Tax=Rhizobium sp. YIM 134829 TaxID=3390453 RepID=UPI003979E91E